MTSFENKSRIAIITGQLVVGGAERQLYLWLSNLDRNRFEVIVLTLHPYQDDYWEIPIETLGIKLHKIPHFSNRIQRLKHIIRVLSDFQPDVIQGWHLFTSPYAGIAAKRLNALSIGALRDSFRRFYKNPIEALLTLLLVDVIFTNSKTAANELQRIKILPSQKILTVQNAIEEPHSDRQSGRDRISSFYNVSTDMTWICTIGRFDPKKRFDLLIEIISLLKSNEQQFHFFIIGDGEERNNLENQITRLKIWDYVTMTGELPEAMNLLRAFDIFTFSSQDEGLPNVVMEAAAAGLPIVTWHLPFYEELLDPCDMAFLVDPGDENAFTEAILQLIRDPSLRTRMGEQARQHMLKSFSVERYTQSMTQVYENLLNSEKGGVD